MNTGLKRTWIITDWARNIMFDGKEFKSFDDAWDFLYEFFDMNQMDADEWGQEYDVMELTPKHNTTGKMLREWD